MAEASIHIHIDTPVDIAEVDKILTAAMEAKNVETPVSVPTGYRCALCFRSDGGHDANCTVGAQALSKQVMG